MTTARHPAIPPQPDVTDLQLLRGARIANVVTITAVIMAALVLGLAVARMWPPKRSMVDATVVEPQ